MSVMKIHSLLLLCMNVIPAFAGLIINNAPDNTNNQVDSSLNAPADDVATAPEDSLNVWQNDQNAQFDTNAMSFTGQTAGDGPNYAINTAPKDTLKQWTNGQNTNPDINTMSFTAQTASILCGLPICGGQTSFYDFGPRDEFSCENEIGKGHESNQFQVVALPSWFMQDGYCGKHLELWWTNPATGTTGSTKAIIGDKCPPESCHRNNRRIDLSRKTFAALGGDLNDGILNDVQWRLIT